MRGSESHHNEPIDAQIVRSTTPGTLGLGVYSDPELSWDATNCCSVLKDAFSKAPWSGALHIGQYSGQPGTPNFQMIGRMAGVKIYHRPLNAAEITATAQSPPGVGQRSEATPWAARAGQPAVLCLPIDVDSCMQPVGDFVTVGPAADETRFDPLDRHSLDLAA